MKHTNWFELQGFFYLRNILKLFWFADYEDEILLFYGAEEVWLNLLQYIQAHRKQS